MRNLVETGFDVALYDPLISLGCEQAHLGHRVVCPAIGAKPVGAREKVRLKDRLQHQLQGCLGHPVPDGRNPQTTQLPARLGNHPLPYRQRREAAVLELRPQLIEEPLDTLPDLDGTGGTPVHPGRAGTLVTPHPIPRHQQEGGIGDKVEQVIKPAVRLVTSPTVQLRLDLQYPSLGPEQRRLQFVGIHRRSPPGLPVPQAADLLVPFAVYVPLTRSDYYGTSATTRRHRRTTHLPTATAGGSVGSLPTFITVRSTGEAASSTPAASPRLRRRPSAWPPHRHRETGFEVAAPPGAACAASRPKSVRFEPVEHLRGFKHWFLSSTFR